MNTIGQIRNSSVFTKLQDSLRDVSTLPDAVYALHLMLSIPKGEIVVATDYDPKSGKPVLAEWQMDQESIPTSIDLDRTVLSPMLHGFCANLNQERGRLVCRMGDAVLLFSSERIQTGGGHNDMATYAQHVVVSKIQIMEV